jgi:hypothetical protein
MFSALIFRENKQRLCNCPQAYKLTQGKSEPDLVLAAEVATPQAWHLAGGVGHWPICYSLLGRKGWPPADLARRIGGRGWQSGHSFPKLWQGGKVLTDKVGKPEGMSARPRITRITRITRIERNKLF